MAPRHPSILAAMAPVVGISSCLDERERWRAGREYVYLDRDYAAAVAAAGGTPVLLPLQPDPAALVREIDALLLPGGDDFLPDAPYPADVRFDPVPERQRAFDDALLRAALERALPVLGICYGAQLLALHHGGSLHHHIPLDVPGCAEHRLPETTGRHALDVVPGTRLAAIVGAARTQVNSLHHQAVATPGRGLRVSARSADGVIEAVEGEAGGFLLGVQWHPEKLAGAAGQGLFAALVAACGRG